MKTPSTLRIGRRYRANRLDGAYDTIIIGSGPSGLSTAACLSKMGQKVLVLEQHYTAGGLTHAYSRNGFEWDVGVHLINDVFKKSHIFRKVFDFISENRLQWAKIQNEQIIFDVNGYPPINLTTICEQDKAILIEAFPAEQEAIEKIYALATKTILRAMPILAIQKLSGAGAVGQFIARTAQRCMPKDAYRTGYEVISDYTANPHLIQAVCSLWPAFGLTPERLSFVFMAAILNNRNPMAFPVGGSSRIAETIIPTIQAAGGEVFTYAKVEQILVENNRAVGVKMADGTDIFAPAVVSCAGVFNTFNHLVPKAVTQALGYDKKLAEVQRSVAHLNLFVGLNDSNENLNLHSGHLFALSDVDIAKATQAFDEDLNEDLPLIFLTFPSAKDPQWNQRYPGKSTSSLIVYIDNFDHFEQWRNEQWEKRGASYDQLKEELSQRLLGQLYKHYPHLEGKVEYYELSTPLSTRYFCMYEKGEIYGLHHNTARVKQNWLQSKTKIKGLYLTGQDILTVAHTPCVMSGAITASSILGWRKAYTLWRRIVKVGSE